MLIYAFIVLARVKIALVFGSYRSVLRWTEGRAARLPPHPVSVPVAAWSVRHAARFVPGARCLAQALSLHYLLLRAGEECVIRIGVKSGEAATLDAHAWVMHEGRCIIGGTDEDLQSFTRLVDL